MEVCCGVNPLLIDDVVEAVFEYVKLADLKRCRLVCHTWCRNASKWMPSKCRQGVLFGDGKKQFDLFLKLCQSSLYPLPHRKITLQTSILSLNRSQSLELFFTTCSSFLVSLFITYQDESHQLTGNSLGESDPSWGNCLFPSLTELPYLKHLHYEELPISGYYVGGNAGGRRRLKGHKLFDKLLRACVNLERLDLILQDTSLDKTEHHFLSLVNCSKTFGTLRHLRKLMLKLPLQDYHFELLRRAKLLSLASVQLRFQNEQCSTISPLKFFGSCASSLTTLSTNVWMKGFSDRKMDDDLQMPCMPKVDTLEISQWRSFLGDHHRDEGNLPFNFSYKSSFPNLKKLNLQSHSWERCWLAFFPVKEVCPTLQELKLPKMLESCRGIVIPKIARTFPQLRKLDITVINSSVEGILSDIFCYLCGLEYLSVSFLSGGMRINNNNNHLGENGGGGGGRTSMCIDYVMTGIPEGVCKKIYSEDKIPNVQMDGMSTGYSLASLTYLKSLQLKNLSSVNYGIPQFTDITGYLALMRLKRLKVLSLWRSQMSDECILELERRFKLFIHPNF